MPCVLEFNMISCPYEFKQIAVALGEDVTGSTQQPAAEKAINAVRCLIKEISSLGRGLAEVPQPEGGEHIPTPQP